MRHAQFRTAGLVFFALCVPALASAKPKSDAPPPKLYLDLGACRSIADAAERLACFDKASAALEQAVNAKDVYMVDRQQVKETRKSLFGLTLPRLGIFGGGEDDPSDTEAIRQIESTVQQARANRDGWLIVLADGSAWQQTDNSSLGLSPKQGMAVIVKRGALGSFIMKVDKMPGFKVRRTI